MDRSNVSYPAEPPRGPNFIGPPSNMRVDRRPADELTDTPYDDERAYSPAARWFLGIASVTPLILFAVAAITGQWVSAVVGMFTMLLVIVYLGDRALKLPDIPSSSRTLWLVFLILGGPFAHAFFWWVYLAPRRDARRRGI